MSEIADMICGNDPAGKHFRYRTIRALTMFFEDAGASASEYPGFAASRARWTEGVLEEVIAGPWPGTTIPPEPFSRMISLLMEQEDATGEAADRPAALAQLNNSLKREGFANTTPEANPSAITSTPPGRSSRNRGKADPSARTPRSPLM